MAWQSVRIANYAAESMNRWTTYSQSANLQKWVLKEAMEATGALVKLGTATNFVEAAAELNKVTLPAWGLQWNVYGVVMFHIWKQLEEPKTGTRKERHKARGAAEKHRNGRHWLQQRKI